MVRLPVLKGERLFLSNELCHQFTHEQRQACDIILTTAKTIQQDNPAMNVRLNGSVQSKPVAIIDSHLSLTGEELIFTSARYCHVFHHETEECHYPNSTFYAMPLQYGRMDLSAVINHLGSLGYHDVWVEAGSALFNSLHGQGLVHKTYLYIVPKCLGKKEFQLILQVNCLIANVQFPGEHG